MDTDCEDTFLIRILSEIGVQGIPDTVHNGRGGHGWFNAENGCDGI